MTKVYVLLNYKKPNGEISALLVPTQDLVSAKAVEIKEKGTVTTETQDLKRKATEFRIPEIPKKYRTTKPAE